MFIDPTDIFLIWDPYYSRHTRKRADSGEGMTFVEAVFSFVFGDGNPNENYEVCVGGDGVWQQLVDRSGYKAILALQQVQVLAHVQ